VIPRYDVLTVHPEQVRGPLSTSIIGRAVTSGLVSLGVHDIRDHAKDRHRSVDDTPYGGGAGMVMKVDVVADALRAVQRPDSHVILTSAAGKRFDQRDAERLATMPHVIVVCGHYEGIDARVEDLVDEELSLGDFVLTGGELAAVAFVDATARLVPGVLGNAASAVDESFSTGLLEYPQYTRPKVWEGREVPEILLSGHHARIRAWRHERAIHRTRARRPDLLEAWEALGSVPGVDEETSGR
jgi:tRNA (guanine37-N1)-methyltransferase